MAFKKISCFVTVISFSVPGFLLSWALSSLSVTGKKLEEVSPQSPGLSHGRNLIQLSTYWLNMYVLNQ